MMILGFGAMLDKLIAESGTAARQVGLTILATPRSERYYLNLIKRLIKTYVWSIHSLTLLHMLKWSMVSVS